MSTPAAPLPRVFRALDALAVFGAPTPLAGTLAERLCSPTMGVIDGLLKELRSRGGFERRILALVDGAPFHRERPRQPLRSLEQAQTVLGARALEILALALALPLTPPAELRAPGLDAVAWQRHNLLAASAALCLAREGSAHLAEEVFLLGLLDRAGVPLLAAALPGEYPVWYAALPPGTDLARAEREEWGVTQVDAARAALPGWKLPQRLWRALAAADAPLDAEPPENARERELSRLLRAARDVVRAIETDSRGPALADLDAHTRSRGLTTERRDALLSSVAALGATLAARVVPPAPVRTSSGPPTRPPRSLLQLDLLTTLLDRLWRDEPPCATELILFAEATPAADDSASPPWDTLMLGLAGAEELRNTELRWARWPGGLAAVLRSPDPGEIARHRSELESRLGAVAAEAGAGTPSHRLRNISSFAAQCGGPTSRAETKQLFEHASRGLERAIALDSRRAG